MNIHEIAKKGSIFYNGYLPYVEILSFVESNFFVSDYIKR